MTTNPRNRLRARGIRIRRSIAGAVLPRLRVGGPVPSSVPIARAVGISHVAAWRHLRRMLAEHGVEVEPFGRGQLIVTGIRS
jgi:hypothetical protein